MTDILTRAARALCKAQSGADVFDDLEEEAQEAAREHVRAVLESLWQPIKTAPKDAGILIAGRASETHPWRISEAYWQSFGPHNEGWVSTEPCFGDPFSWEPTNWMPLPEPPK